MGKTTADQLLEQRDHEGRDRIALLTGPVRARSGSVPPNPEHLLTATGPADLFA